MVRDDSRREEASDTTSRWALTGSTQTDLCSVSQWILEKYCRKRAGLMDVERLGATAEDGKSVVVYDQNRFQHDTA